MGIGAKKGRGRLGYVTEISESDFRALGVKGRGLSAEGEWDAWSKVDSGVASALALGCRPGEGILSAPVTVAVHRPGFGVDGLYYDPSLCGLGGPRSCIVAFGLSHIYSSRDYFESRGPDGLPRWKVRKDETLALYRIHLDSGRRGE